MHIWRASLDQSATVLQALAESLSADERQRVERSRIDSHRRQTIASRGILRAILGRYLAVEPAQIQFRYADQGKPILINRLGVTTLEFNLSHSQDLVLYAIAHTHPVGVDVEYDRAIGHLDQLIHRYFSPRERNVIQSLPPADQSQAFLTYWTCKEATLKATGQGIMGLQQVEVLVTDRGIQVSFSIAPPTDQPRFSPPWKLQVFEPEMNYRAAVAVGVENPQFAFWQWESREIVDSMNLSDRIG